MAELSTASGPLGPSPTQPTSVQALLQTAHGAGAHSLRRGAVRAHASKNGDSRPARITIIDSHVLFAGSLAAALEPEGFIVTVIDPGEQHATLATVLAAALRSGGRLILLEQHLGLIGDSLRLIMPLTASGATVVLLTESTDQIRWGAAVHQGAKDVLHKACSLQELVGKARRVRDGLPLMSREERTMLIEAALSDRDEVRAIRARLDRLTRREMEILGALMSGDRVPEIARAGVVTVTTVRTQVKSILYKLELTSQLAAVGAAHRAAWRPPAKPTSGPRA